MKPKLSDHLHLHFIVLIWGFTAILGLLISVSALALVLCRTLLAAVGLGLLLYFRGELVWLPRIDRLKLWATGGIIALHWITFFLAARLANASVCLAGMATCSFWTSLLEPLVMRRRVRALEVVLGVVVIIGLYVVFHFENDRVVGLLLAIFSAMLASIFTVINSQFTQRQEALMITFYEMLGAFVVSLVFLLLFLVTNGETTFSIIPVAKDWFWIAVLAFVCTVYAYSTAVQLMRKFSAFAVNLTVNLEPVYGIALAVIVFGGRERMTTGFYVGTLIIVASILAYPLLNGRLLPQSREEQTTRTIPK